MQHVSCGSLRFTPELTSIIMNHYETMIGHENSGLHIDSIIVNKTPNKFYVELRAGGRHGVFWDFCEVFLNDGNFLIKKRILTKFFRRVCMCHVPG